MSTQKRKQGFTLIELMIVVAVIGILAAALVPNLLGARQQAVQAQVEACARSIQTAQTVFVGENGSYAATQAELEADPYNSFLACDFTAVTLTPATNQPTNNYNFELDHSNLNDTVVVTADSVTTAPANP